MEVTLCLLIRDGKILLAKKKRGFGAGLFNGVGGKVEKGETVDEAMLRETNEEVGVKLTEYKKVGEIDYDEFYNGAREKLLLHLYIANEWVGDLVETDEMAPKWFEVGKIPYDKMFVDDKYWLPLVLEGKFVKAYFKFDENWNILEKKIEATG